MQLSWNSFRTDTIEVVSTYTWSFTLNIQPFAHHVSSSATLAPSKLRLLNYTSGKENEGVI